jgi:hypothetical protein
MQNTELDHDFVIDVIFKIDGREKYIPGWIKLKF